MKYIAAAPTSPSVPHADPTAIAVVWSVPLPPFAEDRGGDTYAGALVVVTIGSCPMQGVDDVTVASHPYPGGHTTVPFANFVAGDAYPDAPKPVPTQRYFSPTTKVGTGD
ncbi:hypothetical protein H257_10724 [Aphanomyces astaci]|uniref:Uncharacterized protein n=1 Tax=Aphanomyces astaci TaxID=112090 RepID=W4G6N8_APHAT|nr:hypothetical protein H257_10724 [Aphanomyces astaci]ETV74578.1 hypothetical protein H257_10724 [Aphanomyces astaci]|eukprot:XP_009835665.1 hypothetical protein H257_10724 [Aphanomyces astaci]